MHFFRDIVCCCCCYPVDFFIQTNKNKKKIGLSHQNEIFGFFKRKKQKILRQSFLSSMTVGSGKLYYNSSVSQSVFLFTLNILLFLERVFLLDNNDHHHHDKYENVSMVGDSILGTIQFNDDSDDGYFFGE